MRKRHDLWPILITRQAEWSIEWWREVKDETYPKRRLAEMISQLLDVSNQPPYHLDHPHVPLSDYE